MSNRTIEQLSGDIENEEKIMDVHKANGNYADAEKSRLKIEELRTNLTNRALAEMQQRHRKEHNDLAKANADEMASFNQFWNKKAADVEAEGRRAEEEMSARHQKEQQETRQELDVTLSPKVKESSELLNLRKMEAHMVKQKK